MSIYIKSPNRQHLTSLRKRNRSVLAEATSANNTSTLSYTLYGSAEMPRCQFGIYEFELAENAETHGETERESYIFVGTFMATKLILAPPSNGLQAIQSE